MGSALSRLKDDFFITNNNPDLYDRIVLMDVSDILDEMHATILKHGETPVYGDPHYGNICAFMFDLYDAVGYTPEGIHYIAANVRDVLDAAPQYFDCLALSPLQRQCWYVTVQKMVERFMEFRMYDHTHIHRFDFHDYQYGILYMRHP